MELHLLGWASDSPRVTLDHERFAYAGNFATGRTGIAVAVDDEVEVVVPADEDWSPSSDDVLAAASFDEDRAAENALRIRYVSVREDRRGEGLGPALLAYVTDRAIERGFDRVRIGVNNPIAYQACYRAGFAFTGEESGMGELVLEAPAKEGRSTDRYREGLDRFADRELPPEQRAVLERHSGGTPPPTVEASPQS
ncbi:GNAT family N-acetyltransferase [Salinarchaeum chitinilyticum]